MRDIVSHSCRQPSSPSIKSLLPLQTEAGNNLWKDQDMSKINMVATNAAGETEVLMVQDEASFGVSSGYTFLNDTIYGLIGVINKDGELVNLRQFNVREVSEHYNDIYGLYGGDTPALASALHSYFQETGTAGINGLAELPVSNDSSLWNLQSSPSYRKSVLDRVTWVVGATMTRHDVGDFTVDSRGGTEQFPTYSSEHGISVDTVSLGRRLNITRGELQLKLRDYMVRIGEARGGRRRYERAAVDYSNKQMKRIAAFREHYAHVLNQTVINQNSLAILTDMVAKRITNVPFRKVYRTGADSWTI